MFKDFCQHVCTTNISADMRVMECLGNGGMFPSHDIKGVQNEMTLIYDIVRR